MKLQLLLLIVAIMAISTQIKGQSRTYQLQNGSLPRDLDGVLTDDEWEQATLADAFTTTLPRFGAAPQHPTTVRMLAAPDGLFIAVDCKTEKVRADGSTRDDTGTADYFSVGFDTWNDDQNAFVFTVTAAGQLIDQRVSSGNVNTSFNSSWKAKTRRQADGWTAEIWIPFSALRFPTTEGQDWGIQFTRFDRSSGETSTWAPQDPLIRDQVLQYGQLVGLGYIEQHKRLGLTAMAGTKRHTQIDNFGTDNSLRTHRPEHLFYALDGRISFNSATTLDINIVPDYIFQDNLNYSIYGPDYIETPISRPLITEEYALFNKLNTFWPNPKLNSAELARFYTSQPGISAIPDGPIKALNTSRLTTRTKGGLAIGIHNTVFDRPDFRTLPVLPILYFTSEDVSYPVYPNYNQIAVEKAFRNNSWVQFTNSNLYLKSGMTTNQAAIGGQWRDITNRFEVKGQYQLNTQFTSNTGAFSVAESYLSAGKVNGKYTWGGSWSSPNKAYLGILMPSGFFADPSSNHQLKAHFTRTNYSPRTTRWQNISQSITTNSYISSVDFNQIAMAVTASLSGLDSKLRTWSGSITSSPARHTEILDFSGAEFLRELSVPLYLSVGLSTDARKKWVIQHQVQYSGNLDRAATQIASANIDQYVLIHRRITLGAQTQLAAAWNQYNILTIPDVYYTVRKSSNLQFRQTLSCDLYLSSKCQLNIYGGIGYSGYTQQQAYSIQPDGKLALLTFSFPNNDSNFAPKWSAGGAFKWYFTPSSLLRLSARLDNLVFNDSIGIPVYESDKTRLITANLSFLYTLNN